MIVSKRPYIRKAYPLLALLGITAAGTGCNESGTKDTAAGDTADTAYDASSYVDSDEDTILDFHEGEESDDQDGDGSPNYLDTDSDGDDINDRTEAGDSDPYTLPIDSDGDGVQDFLDTDSDNNGISDEDEKNASGSGPGDTDEDGVPDYRDDDNDGDGISDETEIGDDPLLPLDSDADGVDDYMDTDSDNDGALDMYESGTTEWEDEPQDTDGDGTPDYLDLDSDDDGITDEEESGLENEGDEPRDTDGDGLYDFQDTDADGDGLTDAEELATYGTDPYDTDTDGDSQSDGAEVAAETDPNDADSMVEGVYVEVAERSEVEESFDFELAIQMGDIAFLIDTTGSMGSTANAMASEFSNIVTEIDATIEDAAYAYATFDDYNCCGYGSGDDKPFILYQQVTTDTSLVQSALSSTQLHSGDDGPESSIEALYQGITGTGYDMGCDGSYDAADDVLPFIADSSDPFGGTAGEHYDSSVSGTGTGGGFGFRDYALPVLIYATDYDLRDPDAGYPTPGGCPQDASSQDVVDELADLGGYLIGVSAETSQPVGQMEDLADRTGSYADTDGDGVADDRLVFTWYGSNADFRELISSAVEQLVNSITFEKVELMVEGDEYGFVTDIEPDYYDDIDPSDAGAVLDFTLYFRGVIAATTEDQLFVLTLNVVGDESTLLDSYDIMVVVPGTSY